jgi:hypothetical protein
MAILMSSAAHGAPPPPPRITPDYEEFQKTGQLPRTVHLLNVDGIHGGAISTPEGIWPKYEVRIRRGTLNRRVLWIETDTRIPLSKSTHSEGGYTFDLGHNDVIPLYDQIYAVRVEGVDDNVVLSRVTDRVPKELHPGLHTRTISMADVSPDLFWEKPPKIKNRLDHDSVTLEFHPVNGHAVVGLAPMMAISGSVAGEGGYTTDRKVLQLEVKKGELLTARGRSYKVLNVVPPQDIEGIGHLVGWIELSADPVDLPQK